MNFVKNGDWLGTLVHHCGGPLRLRQVSGIAWSEEELKVSSLKLWSPHWWDWR